MQYRLVYKAILILSCAKILQIENAVYTNVANLNSHWRRHQAVRSGKNGETMNTLSQKLRKLLLLEMDLN